MQNIITFTTLDESHSFLSKLFTKSKIWWWFLSIGYDWINNIWTQNWTLEVTQYSKNFNSSCHLFLKIKASEFQSNDKYGNKIHNKLCYPCDRKVTLKPIKYLKNALPPWTFTSKYHYSTPAWYELSYYTNIKWSKLLWRHPTVPAISFKISSWSAT